MHSARFRDHPRAPHHKERFIFFSLTVSRKFICLIQPSVPLGFVVLLSKPPSQGRESQEPRNYNPHNDPRAWRPEALSLSTRLSVPEGQRQRMGCGCHPGHPTACYPLGRSGLASLPRCCRTAVCWCWRSRWGAVGVGPWPRTTPSPLVHDEREEACGCHGSAGCAAVVVVRECFESAQGRSPEPARPAGKRRRKGTPGREDSDFENNWLLDEPYQRPSAWPGRLSCSRG